MSNPYIIRSTRTRVALEATPDGGLVLSAWLVGADSSVVVELNAGQVNDLWDWLGTVGPAVPRDEPVISPTAAYLAGAMEALREGYVPPQRDRGE